MAAVNREEALRERRRRRLVRGLLAAAAAVGLPAFANRLVSHRARRLPVPRWGTGDVYRWRHGNVAFQRLGEGPPLVLLHSFGPGHSSLEWRETAELLAPSYQVLAPDFLGWGDSARPRRHYDGALYVELVRDFLADVVAAPAALVAAGESAAYAVRVAAETPDDDPGAAAITALGLVTPGGLSTAASWSDRRDAVLYRLLRLPVLGTAALNLLTRRAALDAYLRRELYTDGAVEEAVIDEHYRSAHRPRAHLALAAHLAGRLHLDVGDELARVTVPVWLAWGRRTRSPRLETADLWLRDLPDAELEIFEHCGTLPHAESPDELAKKLGGFLAARAARGTAPVPPPIPRDPPE